MMPKEYLSQIRHLTHRINRYTRERDQLLELATKPASNSFESHYNPNRKTDAPFVKFVDKANDLDAMIQEDKKLLLALTDRITGLILELEDPDERYLLLLRYIKLASWEQIAVDLNYSISWIYKLHGRALQSFQKKIVENSQG